MDPRKRIVTRLPLTELWDSSGSLPLVRGERLSVTAIADLLRTGVGEFVVADVGRPLRWIAPGESLNFWKREAKPRIVETDSVDLEQFPDRIAYFAWSWSEPEGRTVVVLEALH